MTRPLDAKERRAQHEAREYAEHYGGSVRPAPSGSEPRDSPRPTAARAKPVLRRIARALIVTLAVFYGIGFGLVSWFTTSRVATRWRPTGLTAGAAGATAAALPGRAYGITPDPSISPEAAGVALAALQSPRFIPPNRDIPTRQVPVAGAPWRGIPLPADLFPLAVASPERTTGLARSPEILAFARGALTGPQRQALRVVGTAPAWREFDIVARAKVVDVVGGRFQLPFGPDVRAWSLASSVFLPTREFTHASFMRAAWHLSEGRRDSAEFALRALISFGHALTQAGSTGAEQMAGSLAASGGLGGLARLFALAGDRRGDSLQAAARAANQAALASPKFAPFARGDLDGARRRLIEQLDDSLARRAVRLDIVRSLRATTCGSIRGILTGHSPDVRAALEKFEREFVRVPSDQEVLRAFDREFNAHPPSASSRAGPLSGAASFFGRIYFNPRLGYCSLVAAGWMGNLR